LAGQTQAAVAEALAVHPVTVAKWMARHRVQGDTGLAARPAPGRPRRLTDEQDRQVRLWLSQKATAHGFPTDLWTARRVAELIRSRFGVAFHPNSLREWLTRRGYSPQRPTRRARQRNEEVILHWLANDWPRIQKSPRRQRPTRPDR
jgi:transposase